jgi:hypothetical protein
VKPEEMCNFFTKFISASKVLVVPDLFFWLTLITIFREIPEATFPQLMSIQNSHHATTYNSESL